MYEFKEEFTTGIEQLDAEHKKIFELTDHVYQLLTDENILFKEDEFHEILDGLQDYVIEHFTDEEAYMESIQFAELDWQKEQHQKFAEKVNEFSEAAKALSLKNQDEVLLKLLDYLVEWLENHIVECDMKYK